MLGAALADAFLLVLTSAHHLYGAWRFDTPWRAHVAHIATWAGVLLGASLIVAQTRRGRPAERWAIDAFTLLTLLVCVAWLGIYEGGYNHGIKTLVGWIGVPDSVFRALFPPSLYEPPGDVLFEVSGVLQLPAGLLAGWCAVALRRERQERR
jgi:hypothetical protein